MGRNDSSGGKWIQGNSSGARKSRLGNGRGQRRQGQPSAGQSGQQFPVIRVQFQPGTPQGQTGGQPNSNRQRSRKRRRRTDGQK